MKTVLLALSSFVSLAVCPVQDGYPTPPDCPTRLFYIQHTNSHNAFVYDANLKGKTFHDTQPINVYRLNFEKGGIKQELTSMQRRMAYGVEVNKTGSNTFDFTLAAYPHKKMKLCLGTGADPAVHVNINKKTIRLRKMFLYCNKLGTSVSSINFYGKDVSTGKEIVENFAIKD